MAADPKSRRGVATREKLVSVAAAVFAARGFAGTTMEEVARSAGVAKGTTYQYFRAKEELYVAALDRLSEDLEAFGRTWSEKWSAPDSLSDARARGLIREFLESNWQLARGHKSLLKLLWTTDSALEPRLKRIFETYETLFQVLQSQLGIKPDRSSAYASAMVLQSFYRALYVDNPSSQEIDLSELTWFVWGLFQIRQADRLEL
jgi:AcrR family transcriptional regulator